LGYLSYESLESYLIATSEEVALSSKEFANGK
jgi:hypothetical protein